jgi:hypothetical protein
VAVLRAHRVERGAIVRAMERAVRYRVQLDQNLARMVRNEIADLWNRSKH